MFNFWKPYPKKKPKKSGWYLCSIRFGTTYLTEYIMDLYYDAEHDVWKDDRRINVFQLYTVIDALGKHVYRDETCIRNDVVAFKRLPHTYRFGKKEGE